jgi:hypothetical protein
MSLEFLTGVAAAVATITLSTIASTLITVPLQERRASLTAKIDRMQGAIDTLTEFSTELLRVASAYQFAAETRTIDNLNEATDRLNSITGLVSARIAFFESDPAFANRIAVIRERLKALNDKRRHLAISSKRFSEEQVEPLYPLFTDVSLAIQDLIKLYGRQVVEAERAKGMRWPHI